MSILLEQEHDYNGRHRNQARIACMRQLLLLNPENATEEEVAGYAVREAARAVVVDADKKVALLRVANKNCYKLPGGGIEIGEDCMAALQRECLEEIGCNVEVVREVGSVVEYRKMFGIKQISYCYVAKVRGEKGTPALTPEEKAAGFEPVWLSYEEALRLMSGSDAAGYEGKEYIVPRDTLLLREARGMM